MWEALPLGCATAGTGSVLDPDEALKVKAELDKARWGKGCSGAGLQAALGKAYSSTARCNDKGAREPLLPVSMALALLSQLGRGAASIG